MTSNVKTKKIMVKVSFTLVVIGIFIVSSLMLSPSHTAISQQQPKQQQALADAVHSDATNSSIVKVQAGGGNGTAPLTTFSPQQVEIKAGSTVSWYNPTQVGEPHTVTFVLDNKSTVDFAAPFSVSSSTQFMSLPPGSNSQPAIIPGKNGMNTVVAINGRVANPVIVGASGSVKFAAPNTSYTLIGTEKYVNSGVILPKGHEKEFPGSSNTFTVTFQKPGIYPYLCIIHPWMKGKVVVK